MRTRPMPVGIALCLVALGLFVSLAGKTSSAQTGGSLGSNVSAVVAKADFSGSSVEEVFTANGQRALRVHLQNTGNYGSGRTVVMMAYPLEWRMTGATYQVGTVQTSVPVFGPVLSWLLPDVPPGDRVEATFLFEEAKKGGGIGVSFSGQNGRVEYVRLHLAPQVVEKSSRWKKWFGLST